MVLKDKLVSDLELRLSKFKPHRDLKFNRSLLAFWIDASRDPLVIQKILQDLGKRNTIDQHFIFSETITPDTNALSQYKVTTTNPIIQLPDDRGIVTLYDTLNSKRIIKTDYNEQEILDELRYANPLNTRRFWYRDDQGDIILKGATSAEDVVVRYVRADWGTDTLLTEIYPITSDLIDLLLEAALQKGLQALQVGQTDVFTNDIPAE